MTGPERDKMMAALREGLRKREKWVETALVQFAEDATARVQDIMPRASGHLIMSASPGPLTKAADSLRVTIGCNATVGESAIGGHSKRSENEPETILPRNPQFGGSKLVSYAIITHELMAFSSGPLAKGTFEVGRSDRASGGATLDEPQLGIEPSDGDRGGQFMRRVQVNTTANEEHMRGIINQITGAQK